MQMKLTEKQYFQLKSPRSLRWSSTVFGAACIVIGLPLCLFLGGLFFLIIGILILAIRKWGLSLAGTIGMFLLFAILLCFSIAELQMSFQALSVGILFALCAVISLGAAILGVMATLDLRKCHMAYLLELEKELGSGNGESV